jgi:hypothetical protein
MRITRSLVAIIVSVAAAGVPSVALAQVSVGLGFGGPGWAVGVVAIRAAALQCFEALKSNEPAGAGPCAMLQA